MSRHSQEQQCAGLWSLAAGVLAELARWDTGQAIVVVPTEDVLLLAVELPRAARHRTALPFAIEEHLAEPLDEVHVVLGEALAGTTYLVAAVRHEVMAGWIAQLTAAGLNHARIVPDALMMPVPPAGSWHVLSAGERIVARTATGTGFAAPAERFAALWAVGGSLPCIACGSPDGIGIPLIATAPVPGFKASEASPALDLRAGVHAAPQLAMARAVRRAAAIASLGLLAHTALLAADAAAATHAAAVQRRATATLLHATLPGTPMPADERLLPGGGRPLPVLVQAAAALAPVGSLSWTRLGWTATDDRLTLGVEAADMAGLQRAAAALTAAGLDPVGGAVTSGKDRTDGEFVIRGRDA